jgi:hypothetical protein
MFNTPILFLIFNRPDTTKKVFNEIRKIKPKRLFVAADGFREGKDGEKELCELTRKLVIDTIDWECEVKTQFRDANLGCGLGPCTAINWFFEHVEEGIILEDDCVPDPSFFNYCELLLERYRNNEKIMSISGDNFQNGVRRGDGSYYFSNIFHGWGWATWKRAWSLNDFYMKKWPEFKTQGLLEICNNDIQKYNYWNLILDSTYTKTINADPWDYQFLFSIWYHKGINIHPNMNLVSNIGFGNGATHTHEVDHIMSNCKVFKYEDKIPSKIEVDFIADDYTFYNYYCSPEQAKKQPKRNLSFRDHFYLFRQKLMDATVRQYLK